MTVNKRKNGPCSSVPLFVLSSLCPLQNEKSGCARGKLGISGRHYWLSNTFRCFIALLVQPVKLTRLPLSLLHSTILISYLIKHFLFVHFLASWRCCLKPHALPLSRIFQSYAYPNSPCPLLSKLSIDSYFFGEPFPFEGVQVCRTFHAWYGKSLCGSFCL